MLSWFFFEASWNLQKKMKKIFVKNQTFEFFKGPRKISG